MMTKNQCYSHEPHWELSKKEVKNVFHYEESNLEKPLWKSTLSSRTALNNTIMNQTINHLSNLHYPHGLCR